MHQRRTVSGAGSKAEAHGSRAGAASPGVRALSDLYVGHVQECVSEINGACNTRFVHVCDPIPISIPMYSGFCILDAKSARHEM